MKKKYIHAYLIQKYIKDIWKCPFLHKFYTIRYIYIYIYIYISKLSKLWKTKPLILIVSCPFGNLQSSRYTKFTVTVNLQYNGFLRNDVVGIVTQ